MGLSWLGFQMRSIQPGRATVAVDPGLKTGVAYVTHAGDVFGWEGDWLPAMELVSNVLWRLAEEGPTKLVSESFIISGATAKKSQAPWSLEGIGVCRYLAARYDVPFELQTPAEAKAFVTPARLKEVGWYHSTPGGHVNDALRHLYLRLAHEDRVRPGLGIV